MKPELVTRGDLTESAIADMDEMLAYHDLPASSPYETPDTLAFVCLGCGSVGISETREARDWFIENMDPTCCGTTVVFHSDHKVLVNPAKLTFVRKEVIE